MDKFYRVDILLKNIPYNPGEVERLLDTIVGVYFDVVKVSCCEEKEERYETT